MPIITPKPKPRIMHAIVGTAGHVDHGKTSLVRLLTGCDTDRLPEEKARGMSIDLGFAPCLIHGLTPDEDNEGGSVVGLVDVPGHKDFIRNMVAGAASIDVLLLVVAADDGVMPQTLEHMKIIRLLRSPKVMVALTKIDMVSPDLLEAARQDIALFLQNSGFPDAPIIPVSNKTGEGIGDIRDTLASLIRAVLQSKKQSPTEPSTDAFRMNVERVFSVKGYGTVVTGIPLSGQIRLGEKATLAPLPTGPHELTVRTVQTYKYPSDAALAHCCCAINVREIDSALITRGMTLSAPNIFLPTTQLLVALENATDSPAAPFKRRFPARLHTGTAAVEVTVKLIEIPELPPAQKAYAHIILDQPLVIAAGDRFILRSLSPALTLGGGIVLSARTQRLRRHADILPRLQQAEHYITQNDPLASELLAGPSALLSNTEALRLTQAPTPHNQTLLSRAAASNLLVELPGGECIIPSRLAEISEVLEKLLARYHRTHPYVHGMQPTQVCDTLHLNPKSFPLFAQLLAKTGQFALRHNHLALASFKPNLSERHMKLYDQLLQLITQAGVNAPARGNLMKDLALTEPDMKLLEKLLTSQNAVVVLDGNFMSRAVFTTCREKLLALFAQSPIVDLNAYRDALQTNRKITVALLDAFDAEGLTRRTPEGRTLKPRPSV